MTCDTETVKKTEGLHYDYDGSIHPHKSKKLAGYPFGIKPFFPCLKQGEKKIHQRGIKKDLQTFYFFSFYISIYMQERFLNIEIKKQLDSVICSSKKRILLPGYEKKTKKFHWMLLSLLQSQISPKKLWK